MGSPQPSQPLALGSSTEPESESSEWLDEPDTPPMPPKPKHWSRRPKQIVVKEKIYRICHGSRQRQKQCNLCSEKFPTQKDLNAHVLGVHSFKFLCKSRACGKDFTSQATLDKHQLIHQGPHFFCTACGNGFLFKYQLNNHANTHTDFAIKCHYPRCGKVYKSEDEYRRHKKVHETAYQEYTCTTCGKHFSGKKYRNEHMAIHLDEPKNKCPKCSKKYRRHSSLSKHINVKHPPTPCSTPERSPSPEF